MSPTSSPEFATGVGLGYGIAIAVSILVLISAIMLASYACVKVKAGGGGDGSIGGGSGGGEVATIEFSRPSSYSQEPVMILMGLGLDKPMIETYPKIVLGESRRLPGPNHGPCSICLSDYSGKETVRVIPGCNHCFHVDCVDDWLRVSGTCPMCRNSPAASPSYTPLTTPLSELVPLAFNRR